MILRATVICLAMAGPAWAQSLQFPSNATLTREDVVALDSYAVPTDIWADGELPLQVVEGQVTRQAWRIAAPSLTTLQILRPLREQLRNDRFRVIFECQTEACGGFDFRFSIATFPPPEMRINIGDFRFLASERQGSEGMEYLTLFVSRTAQAGFVEITYVAPAALETAPIADAAATPLRALGSIPDAALADQLDTVGHSILADLAFDTGSAQLGAGPFVSLQALADYLADFPDRRIALVGHTDSSGSLEANIALSKRRAGSVLERLVAVHGVPRRQLEAQGMGYLSPIASNLTQEGREANRRVEVIVTSTR
ncbi:OmpA family protein [Yoonia sp.]|uniref:OmpA family protein n=1 Tax=Yoonia sp. TaxID=2212373 RepID=UPI002FD98F69